MKQFELASLAIFLILCVVAVGSKKGDPDYQPKICGDAEMVEQYTNNDGFDVLVAQCKGIRS